MASILLNQCRPEAVSYEFDNLESNIEHVLHGASDSDYAKAKGLQLEFIKGLDVFHLEHRGKGAYVSKLEAEIKQSVLAGDQKWKAVRVQPTAQGIRLCFMDSDTKEVWWLRADARQEVALDVINLRSGSVCQYCSNRRNCKYRCPLIIEQLGDDIDRTVYIFDKRKTLVSKVAP